MQPGTNPNNQNNLQTPLMPNNGIKSNEFGMPNPPENTFNYDLPKNQNHYPEQPVNKQWNQNQINNQNPQYNNPGFINNNMHKGFTQQQYNPNFPNQNPNFNPQMNQNRNPQMHPQMNSQMRPQMNPQMNPNRVPQMNPYGNQQMPVRPVQPRPAPPPRPNIIIVNNTTTQNNTGNNVVRNYYEILPNPKPDRSVRVLSRRCRHIGFTLYRKQTSPIVIFLGVILLIVFFPISLLVLCFCYSCIFSMCRQGYHHCSNCRRLLG